METNYNRCVSSNYFRYGSNDFSIDFYYRENNTQSVALTHYIPIDSDFELQLESIYPIVQNQRMIEYLLIENPRNKNRKRVKVKKPLKPIRF